MKAMLNRSCGASGCLEKIRGLKYVESKQGLWVFVGLCETHLSTFNEYAKTYPPKKHIISKKY
jgi:hypothetical protein